MSKFPLNEAWNWYPEAKAKRVPSEPAAAFERARLPLEEVASSEEPVGSEPTEDEVYPDPRFGPYGP